LCADYDDVCASCHTTLRGARARGAAGGEWGYLFAAACGVIPFLTLGGFVPVLVGLGGASACVQTARARGVPLVLRFLGCAGITAGCWVLLGATRTVMLEVLRRA
jgi:hypothetical protein